MTSGSSPGPRPAVSQTDGQTNDHDMLTGYKKLGRFSSEREINVSSAVFPLKCIISHSGEVTCWRESWKSRLYPDSSERENRLTLRWWFGSKTVVPFKPVFPFVLERVLSAKAPRWTQLPGSPRDPSLWSWRPQRWGVRRPCARGLSGTPRSPRGSPDPPSAGHSCELNPPSEKDRDKKRLRYTRPLPPLTALADPPASERRSIVPPWGTFQTRHRSESVV